MSSAEWFLGLDSSTQGLKAVAVDAHLAVQAEYAINFDAQLPEFKTQGGVHRNADGLTVTSPPLMWVAALDLLLARMQQEKFPFAKLASISGSGQQHGSVYLAPGTREVLRGLQAEGPLQNQLGTAFAVKDSPIWMDSSTAAQCREREAALGGAQAVAELTGSRAYERFTGNQIAKIARIQPDAYQRSERISLVSSFIASLFLGDYAPIDYSDGSGMNLMNIRTRQWDPRALEVTAPGLASRLGLLVASHTVLGKVCAYFTRRYGIPAECLLIAFSGDNPNSLAALRLKQAGEVAISLGTSDTCFGSLSAPKPSATEGHILANPVDPGGYMAMICYKNGSLTREAIRDLCGVKTWGAYNELMRRTPVGNSGHIGFYVREPEITPPILKTGMFRFLPDGQRTASFAPEVDARAVVEGQFLSMRLHGANVGLQPTSILATGGASVDRGILRVMSDVFGAPVLTGELPNSAALGAAYRTRHGWVCRQQGKLVPFAEVVAEAPPFQKTMEPDSAAHAVYSAMLAKYAELERTIL